MFLLEKSDGMVLLSHHALVISDVNFCILDTKLVSVILSRCYSYECLTRCDCLMCDELYRQYFLFAVL